ncbi:MAG: hypothetical protein JXB88_02310 [Spirochaetales bacterium]|nr:hypothetical protein [Spirochaetales bacterium]
MMKKTPVSKHLRTKNILILTIVSIIMVSGMWIFNNLFVLRDPAMITSGLGIFIIIVVILIGIASIIIYSLLTPVVKILKIIEENGNPDNDSRWRARRRIKHIPLVFIIVNVCGFFLGPVSMMIVRQFTVNHTFFTLINILTIFYNVCIGLVSSLEQIALSGIVFSRPKEMLGIFDFSDKIRRERGELSLFLKNIIVPIALVLMITSMTGIAGWAYYRDATSPPVTHSGKDHNKKQMDYLFTIGGIFSILLILGLGISASFSYGQVKQIKRMRRKITDLLKGGGKLTQQLSITHFDEIGELTGSINHFIDFINTLLNNTKAVSMDVALSTSSLNDSVTQVTDSTRDLKAATDKVIQTVRNQKDAVHMTGRDIEEIVESIHTVSRNVEKQAGFIEESSTAIAEVMSGINSIKQMVQRAGELSSDLEEKANTGDMKVTDTIENMKQIEKSSGTVEEIVEVISGIASQTNLLAMNAAIEAAHAGDVGRGFAVVADEIRKLAEESDASAKHIGSQIKTMNNYISGGVALTEETGEMLRSIIKNIRENAAIMNEISGAIVEQSAGTGQILSSTQAVVDTTGEIKGLIEAQLEKNRYIRERLEHLTHETGQIDMAVQTQLESNLVLTNILEKIKEVTESNNNVVLRLKSTIGSVNL